MKGSLAVPVGPESLADLVLRSGPPRGHLIFALDYDGTLVAIAERPEGAGADEALRSILASLADRPGITVAVVSGRTLRDLRSVLRPPGNLFLFAEHGAEGFHPAKGEFAQGPRAGAGALESARARLRETPWPPGAWIEEKRSSVGLHLRAASDADAEAAERRFLETVAAEDPGSMLRVLPGKRVIEARLPGIHKGLAVGRLRREANGSETTLVYAGDDRTDEDAFRALRPGEFGIRIGEDEADGAETAANFRLPDPEALRRFLVETVVRTPPAPAAAGP